MCLTIKRNKCPGISVSRFFKTLSAPTWSMGTGKLMIGFNLSLDADDDDADADGPSSRSGIIGSEGPRCSEEDGMCPEFEAAAAAAEEEDAMFRSKVCSHKHISKMCDNPNV